MTELLRGAYAVPLTPFAGTRVDEATYCAEVARIAARGVAGYVVCGSTGEFVRLSADEQLRLLELTGEAGGGKQLIFSTCTNDAADTLRLARQGARRGACAVLVCPPFFYPQTQEQIVDYYRRVAEESPVPVILYRVPAFSADLAVETVLALAEHPNVVGIKDSSANMRIITHLVDLTREERFSVLTGTDDILLPCLAAGCAGSMTALAAIFPERVLAVYEAFARGDWAAARRAQQRMLPALREAESEPFPFGYKRLLAWESGLSIGDKEEGR